MYCNWNISFQGSFCQVRSECKSQKPMHRMRRNAVLWRQYVYILKCHLSDERKTVQVGNIACFMQWCERESTSCFMVVFRIILQNGTVSNRLSLFIQSFHFLKGSEQEMASIISPTLQFWILSLQLQNVRSFSTVWFNLIMLLFRLMFLNFWHICILSKQSLSCQYNSF